MTERYLTAANILKADIEQGKYPVGSKLPGRLTLARRFNTGRGTIDRAIRFLRSRGLVDSRQGAGTFISRTLPPHRIALVCEPGIASSESSLFDVDILPVSELDARSKRLKLDSYDGILWHCPGSWLDEWSGEIRSARQIVINRHFPGTNYVSTDHRGAYRRITNERIALLPQAVPVFLKPDKPNSVIAMREEGFVDACREHGRFYEIVDCSPEFDASLEILRTKLNQMKRPLLLVSAYLGITGAVMSWARAEGLIWQRDIFYSDFDNNYPESVWGVSVTSFIQDYKQLLSVAFSEMNNLINGDAAKVQILLPPCLKIGQT